MQNPTPHSRKYELVAHISKTKGLDGQLVAVDTGTLSVLHEGLEVWIVPPTLEGVRHTRITSLVSSNQKRGVLITLEGVTSKTQAHDLAGRYLLARKADLALDAVSYTLAPSQTATESSKDDYYDDEEEYSEDTGIYATHFIDTANGELGVLEYIKAGPAYDIWVIKGPYGILEIPAVDAYVVEEQEDAILLELPEGFIEITKRVE